MARMRANAGGRGLSMPIAMDLPACGELAVPAGVMHHVVRVESAFNPYAIGVVGGRLARQPRTLPEAVATARMLEARGHNFSLGLAQVNRYNLARYGLPDYASAFQACPNLRAGARILAECHARAQGDWGKAFSCYYSGNFATGFRHGYVDKVFASMRGGPPPRPSPAVAASIRTRLAENRLHGERRPDAPWRLRIATGADATASVPSVTPSPVAAEEKVAVLDRGGGPPRLLSVPAVPASSVAASPRPGPPASDAAFVF